MLFAYFVIVHFVHMRREWEGWCVYSRPASCIGMEGVERSRDSLGLASGPSTAAGGALEELAAAGTAVIDTTVDDDFATRQDGARIPLHFPAFEH